MVISLCLESWEVRETFGISTELFLWRNSKKLTKNKSSKAPIIPNTSQKIKISKVFCSKIP
jgi:hypothetical protein